MWTYILVSLSVLLAVVLYGGVCPFLISADNTELVWLGICLLILSPLFFVPVAKHLKNKFKEVKNV